MAQIGQILLERGWIGTKQLEEAIEHSRQLGGRLGTSLLEIGAITEDLIVEALGEQLGVPVAGIEDLRDIPESIYSLLPAAVAIRAKAIPFRIERGRLDIALLDVNDIVLHDEISFIVGKRLRIHTANEVRIHGALETYYGRECSLRYRNLLRQLDRPAAAKPVGAAIGGYELSATASSIDSSATRSGSGLSLARRLSAPPPPAKVRSIPLSEEERATLEPESRRSRPAAPSDTSEILDQLNRALRDARRADDVAKAIIESLSPHFVRAVLFRVSRGVVTGWMGRGPRLDGQRIAGYEAPLNGASVFREVVEATDGLFMGRLSDVPSNVDLVSLWAGDLATECVAGRLAIHGRPVGILYGDCDQRGVSHSDIGLVQQAASRGALALERCILRQRRRSH